MLPAFSAFDFLPWLAASVLPAVAGDFRNLAPRAVIFRRLATSPLVQSIKLITSGSGIRSAVRFPRRFCSPLSPGGDPVALKPPLPW